MSYFLLRFSQQIYLFSSGCGGAINKASGSISSPNYPDVYKSNTDCTWFITVPRGQRIRFTVDMMDIEQDTNCRYDYLRIGDGPIKGAESRAVICGTRSYDFISQGNQMWVQFSSDGQFERRGFRAFWSVHSLTTTEKILTKAATTVPITQAGTYFVFFHICYSDNNLQIFTNNSLLLNPHICLSYYMEKDRQNYIGKSILHVPNN